MSRIQVCTHHRWMCTSGFLWWLLGSDVSAYRRWRPPLNLLSKMPEEPFWSRSGSARIVTSSSSSLGTSIVVQRWGEWGGVRPHAVLPSPIPDLETRDSRLSNFQPISLFLGSAVMKAIDTVVLTVYDLSSGKHFCCKNWVKQLIGWKIVCGQFIHG